MKDPRTLMQKLTKQAEEVDEQWQEREEYVKHKYLDRFRVRPHIAICFDICTIAIGMFWLLNYGFAAYPIISFAVGGLLVSSVFSLCGNVYEVVVE